MDYFQKLCEDALRSVEQIVYSDIVDTMDINNGF